MEEGVGKRCSGVWLRSLFGLRSLLVIEGPELLVPLNSCWQSGWRQRLRWRSYWRGFELYLLKERVGVRGFGLALSGFGSGSGFGFGWSLPRGLSYRSCLVAIPVGRECGLVLEKVCPSLLHAFSQHELFSPHHWKRERKDCTREKFYSILFLWCRCCRFCCF